MELFTAHFLIKRVMTEVVPPPPPISSSFLILICIEKENLLRKVKCMVTFRTGYVKEGNKKVISPHFLSPDSGSVCCGSEVPSECVLYDDWNECEDNVGSSKKGMHILTFQLSPSHY